MNDAQKDAIVAAAKAVVRMWAIGASKTSGGFYVYASARECLALTTAVHAAEQRWTVQPLDTGRAMLWNNYTTIAEFAFLEAAERVARLLNEDDARGGGK